jgi:hypothetical protein
MSQLRLPQHCTLKEALGVHVLWRALHIARGHGKAVQPSYAIVLLIIKILRGTLGASLP